MKKTTRETFDEFASNYASEVQSSIGFSGLKYDLFTQSKISLISILLKPHTISRPLELLDFGCGVGSLHGGLSKLGITVSGAEISEKSLQIAQKFNPYNKYYPVDDNNVPAPDCLFDCVLAVCVIHHIHPVKHNYFFTEAHRLLKPGGSLIVIEHNPFNPLTRIAVSRCELDRDATLIRRSSLVKKLVDSNYEKIKSGYFMYIPKPGKLARSTELLTQRLPLGAQYYAHAFKPMR